MNIQIPCYYKPTKVLFLDDKSEFLNTLGIIIPSHIRYQTYQNPHRFLQYFQQEYRLEDYRKNCLQIGNDDVIDNSMVNINIQAIHQEIYNAERFNEISVTVVDYAMPGLSGIEVCRALKDLPTRKILLTGEAGLELAVQAFNEGIIHQFILKNTPEYDEQLVKAIANQHQRYYLLISQAMLGNLMKTEPGKLANLSDDPFVTLFNTLCENYTIVEYYLADVQGTFLMLDKNANPFWFIVKDDEDMKNYAEVAEYGEASADIFAKIKNRTHIPYFYSEDDFDTAPEDWAKYLHPAQILEGQKRYYYAVVKDSDLYRLDSKRILSYQDFLNTDSHKH